ncbi:MAG TPA: hypothetical protein VIQ03_13360 [Gammaproteobacteria bacterium]
MEYKILNKYERREEWRKVLNSLDIISLIKRGDYKYHKELFFNGDAGFPDEDKSKSRVFDGRARVIFKMWYDSEPDADKFKKMFIDDPSEYAQQRFFTYHSNSSSKMDDEYGLMGGREKLIVNAIFPSMDYADVVEKNRLTTHLAPEPGKCLTYALNGVFPLIRGINKNPFSPGQYLWEHLDKSIDKIDFSNAFFAKEKLRLVETLFYLRKRSEKYGFPSSRAHVIEMADTLAAKFDNKQFDSTLMSYWDNIDALYEEHFGKPK